MSEYYGNITDDYEDLGFNSDENLFKNEKRKKFDNGDPFELKIYDITVTPTIIAQDEYFSTFSFG